MQLMLPGRCDVKPLLIAARSFYITLMEAGVEIYERQGCILTPRRWSIDGEISVVGWTNLDYRSIEYDSSFSALVRHPDFGQQMQTLFANDMNFAKKISLREWRNVRWVDRAIQWTVMRRRIPPLALPPNTATLRDIHCEIVPDCHALLRACRGFSILFQDQPITVKLCPR